jgi:glycosyltransferase involved in cell wall biosynthesis
MPRDSGPPSRTLVFLVTEDWFFASHFWARARAARAAGWRVVLVARESDAAPGIRASGIEVLPIAFRRRRLNPFAELAFALQLAQLYRSLAPEIVHHVALKPIIIGGLAARLAGVRRIVNAPTGLGFVFSSRKALARLLRPVVALGLRATLTPPGARAIFENLDDLAALRDMGVVRPSAAILIRGAGVDIDEFCPAPAPSGPIRVILIARMIREKGVADFAGAARLLQGQAEFILVGAPDPGNPDSLSEADLRGWEAEGLVTWLGPRRDIAKLLQGAHIAVQPSTFREGLPKSALEAMACGKPLVVTDIPGCRETVVHGETGLIVPPRDPAALAGAIKTLIEDAALRARLGAAARVRAETYFADSVVCAQTLAVYDALATGDKP